MACQFFKGQQGSIIPTLTVPPQSQVGQGTSIQQSMQQASEGFNPAFQPSSTCKSKAHQADFEAAFTQVAASFNKTMENTASWENSEVKMNPGSVDYGSAMQMHGRVASVITTLVNPKLDEHRYPILGEYVFATLLLEAAIQKGELMEGGYEAWILLGETRSMDEYEEYAMCALVEDVQQAEIAGVNSGGMLVGDVTHPYVLC
ncbi:hypothetical protein V8B97DRAFT_1914982 [Scleroderma yunnanense]